MKAKNSIACYWLMSGVLGAAVVMIGLGHHGSAVVGGMWTGPDRDEGKKSRETVDRGTLTSFDGGDPVRPVPPRYQVESDGPRTLPSAKLGLLESGLTGRQRAGAVRFGRILSATPVAASATQTRAAGPGVYEGGACACDDDCTEEEDGSPLAQCREGHCVHGICEVKNAPVDTRCNFDTNWCTDDRCNSQGECLAAVVQLDTRPLNRCPKKCFDIDGVEVFNCDTSRHCSGDGLCILKPGEQCVDNGDGTGYCRLTPDLGRCCSDSHDCEYVDLDTCDDRTNWRWLRIGDVDDLYHQCICPAYSAGVAPRTDDGSTVQHTDAVVPTQRVCAIGLNHCEVDQDCYPRCSSGPRIDESCDDDGDCNPAGPAGHVCDDTRDSCVNTELLAERPYNECPGLLALGDDYELTPDASNPYLRLKRFRFRGGVERAGEIVVFDFWTDDDPPVHVDEYAVRFQQPGMFDYMIEVDCEADCDYDQPCEGYVGHPMCEERRDPPVVVPPKGSVTARVRQEIEMPWGEDDATFRWLGKAAGGADVGANVTTTLWTGTVAEVVAYEAANGLPANPGGPKDPGPLGNNVLIMELLGERIPQPAGACCDRDDNSCVDNDRWECRRCTGSGADCDKERDCGMRRDERCTDRDWKGPRTADQISGASGGGDLCGDNACLQGACCSIADGSCRSVSNAGTCDTAGGTETFLGYGVSCDPNICPQPFARCSISHVACPNGDSDCDSTLGMCDAGLCYRDREQTDELMPPESCSFAGYISGGEVCTHPAGTTQPACVSNEGVCDTDAGTCADGSDCVPYDLCGQHGADACRDIWICDESDPNTKLDCTDDSNICADPAKCHRESSPDTPDTDGPVAYIIDVPGFDPGSGAAIVEVHTLSGEPFHDVPVDDRYKDDCSSHGADHLGWYDRFTVDACAQIVINYCGNDPISPTGADRLEPVCGCAGSNSVSVDEDENGVKGGYGDTCNNDHCCGDGNFSIQFTVPRGTYTLAQSDDNDCVWGSERLGGCFVDEDCLLEGDFCRAMTLPYTMTMHVQPCPLAACCTVTGFCSVTTDQECADFDAGSDCPGGEDCNPTHACDQLDQYECMRLDGVWLGPNAYPPPFQPVAACTGDPCAVGACCTGPGQCDDLTLDNALGCIGAGGEYYGIPGDDPCQYDLCAVCPFQDQRHCQLDTGQFSVPSDRLIGRMEVDDFNPAGSPINRICWAGCYRGQSPIGAGFECSGNTGGTRPLLDYEIVFYEDSVDTGLPGLPVAGQPGTDSSGLGYQLLVDGEEPLSPTSRCFFFTAPLSLADGDPQQGVDPTPWPLDVPLDCYWMKITGLGEIQDQGFCISEIPSSNDGNNLRLLDSDGIFTAGDIQAEDIFFCLDTGLDGASQPPLSQDGGCGDRMVACCQPDGSCNDLTYTACVGRPGFHKFAWPVPGRTCPANPADLCPPLPPNDDCVDVINEWMLSCVAEWGGDPLPEAEAGQCEGYPDWGIPGEICDPSSNENPGGGDCFGGAECTPIVDGDEYATAYRCKVPTDNRLAFTDGDDGPLGCGDDLDSDVWYVLHIPCTGLMTVRTCKNANYDSKMALYYSPGGGCACPAGNANNMLACNDDFCPGSSTTEGFNERVTTGTCMLVRVGGWAEGGSEASAGRGETELDIGILCDAEEPIDSMVPPVSPHEFRKNRYIAFGLGSENVGALKIQVQVIPLTCDNSGKVCSYDEDCPDFATGEKCVTSLSNDPANPDPAIDPEWETIGWVGQPCKITPTPQVPAGTHAALVVAAEPPTPGYFYIDPSTSEPIATLFVQDCEIMPRMTYAVRATVDGETFTPRYIIGTILEPYKNAKHWADVVGQRDAGTGLYTPPNERINVDDVSVMIVFLNSKSYRPHVTVVDLSHEIPNYKINADDLSMVLRAFGITENYPPAKFIAEASGATHPRECPADAADAIHPKCHEEGIGACCDDQSDACLGELGEEECNTLDGIWLGDGVPCSGGNGNNCTSGECLWKKDTITPVNGCPQADCDAYSEVVVCNGECTVGNAVRTCTSSEKPGIQGLPCPSGGQNRQCNVALKLGDCIVECVTNRNFTNCLYQIDSVIQNTCTETSECTSKVNTWRFTSKICTLDNQCAETETTFTCSSGGECRVKLVNGACRQPAP